MNPSVLFWFYKDVDVCRNRLQLIRRDNPDVSIFGLFGGDQSQAASFESQLSPYLDDFFAFPDGKSKAWKWHNGDLMIADWYDQRGRFLQWDTVAVLQWDMLVFGRLSEVFSELREGEILLSSTRPVDEVSSWWSWASDPRVSLAGFMQILREQFGYDGSAVCCQFVVACLPRQFLERYSAVRPEYGFIEYRVPTFARAFGVPVCSSRRFDCWWADEPATKKSRSRDIVLTAALIQIPFLRVCSHLIRRDGARVFHPYDGMFPLDGGSALSFMRDGVRRLAAPLSDGLKRWVRPMLVRKECV